MAYLILRIQVGYKLDPATTLIMDDNVPLYSERSEWADITPLEQYETLNPIAPIAYTEGCELHLSENWTCADNHCKSAFTFRQGCFGLLPCHRQARREEPTSAWLDGDDHQVESCALPCLVRSSLHFIVPV